MFNRNSWIIKRLARFGKKVKKSPVTRFGKFLGSFTKPITKPIISSINLDKKMLSVMNKNNLHGSIMGQTNYNNIAGRVKKFIKDGNIEAAENLAKGQAKKIRRSK